MLSMNAHAACCKHATAPAPRTTTPPVSLARRARLAARQAQPRGAARALAPPDEAEAAGEAGEQEGERGQKRQAAHDQVRDAQEQVLAAHPGVGAQHHLLRARARRRSDVWATLRGRRRGGPPVRESVLSTSSCARAPPPALTHCPGALGTGSCRPSRNWCSAPPPARIPPPALRRLGNPAGPAAQRAARPRGGAEHQLLRVAAPALRRLGNSAGPAARPARSARPRPPCRRPCC